jgi:hypothetical protein
MVQPSLWDRPGTGPPRARRSDHTSSHAAADRQERSGKAEADMRRVLEAVRMHPGLTSRELSERTGLDYHMVARRLPDLARRGLVERVVEAGEPLRWR